MLPRHVRACQHSKYQQERWFIWTWKPTRPEKKTRIPYSCNSWRCETCRRHEAAVTFARIKEACAPFRAEDFVFFVLTLDRDGYYKRGRKPWLHAEEAYKALGRMTRTYLKRLRRHCEIRGWESFGSKWVQVIEAHRSGWPHANILIHCPELAAELRKEQEIKRLAGLSHRESTLIDGEILRHARDCEWGTQSTAEAVRDKDAMAGYVTKLAKNADSHLGEVAKITQLPMNAPARFRRLRSGVGFLPARRKSDATGCLVRRKRSPAGDWEIEAINPPKDPSTAAEIAEVERLERGLIEHEENVETLNVGLRRVGLPVERIPTVLVYLHGRRGPPDDDCSPFAA